MVLRDSKVIMGETKAGTWLVQSVLIPKKKMTRVQARVFGREVQRKLERKPKHVRKVGEDRENFYGVRFRHPSQFVRLRTPDYAENVARNMSRGKKKNRKKFFKSTKRKKKRKRKKLKDFKFTEQDNVMDSKFGFWKKKKSKKKPFDLKGVF